MSLELKLDDKTDSARSDLRQAIMTAFCRALHGSRLPPIGVMALAAEALGSSYRDVADAHRGDGACTCGWRPLLDADVEQLQAALAAAARPASGPDLRSIEVAGRA